LPSPNRAAAGQARGALSWQGALARVLLVLGSWMSSAAASELDLESADAVNEGQLHFLTTAPARPVHHHQNRIRIDAASLASGWVGLAQCHDHLDAVPRTQITFREGFVRDLKIEVASGIETAWTEGASVQLKNVAPGARLCLSAQTRALRSVGQGAFNLLNGPYMRKFLDGYYPMRVTLEVDYPQQALGVTAVSPPPQPGLTVVERPGSIKLDALFEGELRTLIEFRQLEVRE
jgi:hypothetical protein